MYNKYCACMTYYDIMDITQHDDAIILLLSEMYERTNERTNEQTSWFGSTIIIIIAAVEGGGVIEFNEFRFCLFAITT